MIFAANGTQLFLIIEDAFEWFDLRDRTGDGTLEIIIERDNINVFFPGWDDYIDPNNAFKTIRYNDACRFKTLEVIFRNGVVSEGEGVYSIVLTETPEDIDMEGEDLDGTLEDLIGGLTITIHLTPPAPEV